MTNGRGSPTRSPLRSTVLFYVEQGGCQGGAVPRGYVPDAEARAPLPKVPPTAAAVLAAAAPPAP